MVWTTGALGTQFNWDEFRFVDEELEVAAQNVRLGRLNAGAAVLDTHRSAGLGGQIGVVVPGSARMESGKGLATLKLSDREDLAPLIDDIAAGIVRNLSVGYVVHEYEVTERGHGERPLYRAVDWEPTEISFVPVPMDAGAQVRSRNASSGTSLNECVVRTVSKEKPMSWPIAKIREYVGFASEGHIDPAHAATIALDFAERGLSEVECREAMTGILTEVQRSAVGRSGAPGAVAAGVAAINGHRSLDDPSFFGEAVVDALHARIARKQPSAVGREFMGGSMLDIAREMVARQGMSNVRSMSAEAVIRQASQAPMSGGGDWVNGYARSGPGMATSNFPSLLTEAGNRYLAEVAVTAGSPIKPAVARRYVNDFRQISALQLSGYGTLDKVLENGEVKRGQMSERKETYKVESFSKILSLTLQAIINDDLGAFSDVARILATTAMETEAAALAELINSNPAMADGDPVFHANHANLASSGAVPGVDALDEARLAMRSQKDLDGVTPASALPKFVLASPKNETVIEKLVATTLQPTQVTEANPFAGKLVPLIDPRLSANPWYLLASPESCPAIELATLTGYDGPQMETEPGWNTLGQEWRVTYHFGAGIIEHRGMFKNPGA
ncbi:MAG: hypothetical protein KDE55_00020 [Novosphingobium sp.]|nr:hypothetical protein [Novosphingobium sp.]